MKTKKIVLIVDDDEASLRYLKNRLEHQGHYAITATDGEEALQKLTEIHFDVLITDLVMPKMDGLSLIEKVKEAFPKILIIVMSGTSRVDPIPFLKDALIAGASAIYQKPFDFQQLLKHLD